MIIDFHVHAGKGDGFTGPWDTAAPLGRYLQRAAHAGIGRFVLLPVFNSDYAAANRQLAALVATAPSRFVGFAMVHPERDRPRISAMVAEAAGGLGLRGIKVHRHDARLNRTVCEAARRWRLPILYDCVGEVGPIELFAAEFPDVAFVIPHLGSFADDWSAQRSMIDILVRHRNVHIDTSGIRRFDLLEEAVARAGAHKIIFGSDGVFLHPGVELAKVNLLNLQSAQRELVLAGNALRLLGLQGCSASRRAGSLASAFLDRGAAALAAPVLLHGPL